MQNTIARIAAVLLLALCSKGICDGDVNASPTTASSEKHDTEPINRAENLPVLKGLLDSASASSELILRRNISANTTTQQKDQYIRWLLDDLEAKAESIKGKQVRIFGTISDVVAKGEHYVIAVTYRRQKQFPPEKRRQLAEWEDRYKLRGGQAAKQQIESLRKQMRQTEIHTVWLCTKDPYAQELRKGWSISTIGLVDSIGVLADGKKLGLGSLNGANSWPLTITYETSVFCDRIRMPDSEQVAATRPLGDSMDDPE